MDRGPIRLRGYRPDDLDSLYRICLQTADSGQVPTGLFRDPKLPGDVYVAPDVIFELALAFIAEDDAGVGGYIVAALDSQVFKQRLEQDWWPKLRTRYSEASKDQADELSLLEWYALHDIHHPFGAPRGRLSSASRRTCISTSCRACGGVESAGGWSRR